MVRSLANYISLIFSWYGKLPHNVEPVRDFDAHRYLGVWYEIARLDHFFERNLEKVTANYSMRNDGGIMVVNRGFDPKFNEWKKSKGKAYFIYGSNIGRLKVSFFWPLYGGYNIIELDKMNYSYALVCGPNKYYLWILARKPDMEESVKSALIKKAKDLGFNTEKLIFVKH